MTSLACVDACATAAFSATQWYNAAIVSPGSGATRHYIVAAAFGVIVIVLYCYSALMVFGVNGIRCYCVYGIWC